MFELYSRQVQKRERAGKPDVYQYDVFPNEFRQQVLYLLNDCLAIYEGLYPSTWDQPNALTAFWATVYRMLVRELGTPRLDPSPSSDPYLQCAQYFLKADTTAALDVIHLSIDILRANYKDVLGAAEVMLNRRLEQHSIGYEFTNGSIIKKESQYVHAEMVMPALSLLSEEGFDGASAEFLLAHEHYRNGRKKEAINEALKAFESTMKTICDRRNWTYSSNDPAKKLLEHMFQNNLVPSYLQSHVSALRTTLEAGLPTVRNKTSGHGQGAAPQPVTDDLAAYAIHLAAANIILLVQAYKSL